MENEWQIDPQNGQRYRMVGHIREYEMLVRVDGIEIPQSQLADYHCSTESAWRTKPPPTLPSSQAARNSASPLCAPSP